MGRRGFWVLAYVLLASSLLYAASSNWLGDDPFITYRYALNLASGQGFVYNPGEQVLSTTTPLFTLLLAGGCLPVAALSPTGAPGLMTCIPSLARLIGSLSLGLGGLSLYLLGRAWRADWVAWAGLLLYPAFPLLVAHLGAESSLYLALCLGALVCYCYQRNTWAAGLAALATLARPDGVLLALVLVGDFTWRRFTRRQVAVPVLPEGRRGSVLLPLLVYVVVVLPWVLFATWYFGSPIPLTLAAKQAQGALTISRTFLPGLLDLFAIYGVQPGFWLALPLAAVGSVLLLFRLRRQHNDGLQVGVPGFGLLLAWTLLYTLAYSFLGVSRYYWYYAPLVPYFLTATGLGLTALTSGAIKGSPGFLVKYQHTLTAILLALLVVAQWEEARRILADERPRLQAYRQAGEWLVANSQPEAQIGALEVGILGYYAWQEYYALQESTAPGIEARTMLDFAGLLRPEAADLLEPQMTLAEVTWKMIEHFQPDYVVAWEDKRVGLPADCLLLQRFSVQPTPENPDVVRGTLAVYLCTYDNHPVRSISPGGASHSGASHSGASLKIG